MHEGRFSSLFLFVAIAPPLFGNTIVFLGSFFKPRVRVASSVRLILDRVSSVSFPVEFMSPTRNHGVSPSSVDLFSTPFGVDPLCTSEISSTVAHTHPSGSSGRFAVSGLAGSGYLSCQPFGGFLPCELNLASCLASQRARRSDRMRSSSCAPSSAGTFLFRQFAVSWPSTAAFSNDWRYCVSFFWAACSSAMPASS